MTGIRWGQAAHDALKERERAHAKHSATGQSCEQMPWTDPLWLPVLVEEVGEVARALCDREAAVRVREELVQVAAMALAWADAIEHTAYPCGHAYIIKGCGGCDGGAVEFVRDDGDPAWRPVTP